MDTRDTKVDHSSPLQSQESPESTQPATPADFGPADSGSEDLFSDPDTPRTVQRQVFGTDMEVSAEEAEKSPKVWADDTEEDFQMQPGEESQTESSKEIKPYCPQCRSNVHTKVQCTADVIH